MILFLLSLLAGFLTVLAPCTISLLPVIVGGSLNGGHSLKRALVVTGSLGVSVIVFTLLLKVSTSLIAIPQGFWQLLSKNTLYLEGAWNLQSEYAQNKESGAKIFYKYKAKDMYFVASSDGGASVKISIDGKPAGEYAGVDASKDGNATISQNRLYKLIQGTEYGEHTLEIEVLKGTLQAYTFTFG